MAAGAASIGYRAFISYSHQDQAWAQWLHRAIETYRVPSRLVGGTTAAGIIPRRLVPIFRDRDELASATDLGRKVNEALAQSANLIVICSPAAAASRWVGEEVRAFKRLGRADRIFCLIVAGEPYATELAGREGEECFSEALRFVIDDQGRLTHERTEPIAADVRAGKDGKANARLKLIAGMLDVGFDALKQREQQRRNRKWAALAAASFAGMLLTGGLSVYALRARSEAIAQRSEAEGLIEFMLGDLRKKLEPVGRLDVMDSVGERALAYYSKQDAGALDADSLGRRARALHLIGEVDDLRGDLDPALDVFQKAARSTSELLARAPNESQRIFDHAQSVYWVGYVAFQRGQNDVAEKSFNEYKSLAERLVALDPGKADWQAEVEYAYSNLGTLLVKEGRSAEAIAAFERSLDVSSALARQAPDDASRQLDDAQSRAWLADALENEGQFSRALELRTVELTTYKAVLAQDPKNNDAKQHLLVCEHALARLALAQGDIKLALDELQTAKTFAEDLMLAEPDSTLWIESASDTYAALALALHFQGDDAAARTNIARATVLAKDLVRRDSSVVRWRAVLLGQCELHLATLEAVSGRHEEALRLSQHVVQGIDGLHDDEKRDHLIRAVLAAALLRSGDEYQSMAKGEDARAAWQRVVAVLAPDQEHASPVVQTLRASALFRLGRESDARAIAADLEKIGYRHPEFVELQAHLAEDLRAEGALVATARPATMTRTEKRADGRRAASDP